MNAKRALIIVDRSNTISCRRGAALPQGDAVVPVINQANRPIRSGSRDRRIGTRVVTAALR